MPNDLVTQFGWKLSTCQPRHILDPSGARLGEPVHFQEPRIRLIHEQHQEEGEETTQHANVGFLEELRLLGDVVDDVGIDAYSNVDGNG